MVFLVLGSKVAAELLSEPPGSRWESREMQEVSECDPLYGDTRGEADGAYAVTNVNV